MSDLLPVDTDETQDEVIVEDEVRAEVPSRAEAGSSLLRWIIWGVALLTFGAFALFIRLQTNLGVRAPSWNRQGEDYVWRIWWRARNQIFEHGPDWLFVVGYVSLVIVFIALSALAVWIALVPNEKSDDDALQS